ncbi:Sodium/hydrogen exchanger 3 [Capsicum baccatum]|uniref:Sodium/hydrogen exchanger 3 n=1 Tax=Capsicum baccatum TaxID=33114 RepID=A0A2G2WQE3_CAPBA|nr:Sodium/hydrogen exchanger 3 [Capsicum baccatum]
MAYALASLLPKLGSLATSDHTSVVSINLFVALLCTCIVIDHLLEENRWINESITALIIVSVTSFILHRVKTWFGCSSSCLACKRRNELTPSGVQ